MIDKQRYNMSNKELNARISFDKLKSHIDEDIICHVIVGKYNKTISGKLCKVEDFKGIYIDGLYQPFIDESAVKFIVSSVGEILYENPYIKDFYDNRNFDNERRKMFGNPVNKENEKVLERVKQENELKKQKYSLMRDGVLLIKTEMIEEWLEFVDRSINDDTSRKIVEITIKMLKMLNDGFSYEDVYQLNLIDNNLSENVKKTILTNLARFSNDDNQYVYYHNEKLKLLIK